MKTSVFVSMSDRKMASLIDEANRRVIVVAPAVRQEAGRALHQATKRLGCGCVAVVMDCDEEVFRLGYGEMAALKELCAEGCRVRQSSGLRIGVLVCDERAWVFAPTALYVQPEVQSDETPNAVALAASDVESIVGSVLPVEPTNDANQAAAGEARKDVAQAKVEIGHEEIAPHRIEEAQEALERAPPVQFDIARQVRVFEPYLQYVELSLTGAAIQRRRIRIPESLQSLGATTDLEGRLWTTFDLIEKHGDLSSDKLEAELHKIRRDFTRQLGKNHGRVVLKSQKPKLKERLDELRKKLQTHQAKVAEALQQGLDHSRDQVVEYYLPLAKAKLPDALLGQSLFGKPTDQDIRDWLSRELKKVFPDAGELLCKMTLDEHFKDVTYETLNRTDFFEALEQAYPGVPWDKPYQEFKAAGERAARNQG